METLLANLGLAGQFSLSGVAHPIKTHSRFEIEALSSATVDALTLVLRRLQGNTDPSQPTSAATKRLALAFWMSDRLFLVNKKRPEVWDPLSGDYSLGSREYIRLHCNFKAHRAAAVGAVLGAEVDPVSPERSVMAKALAEASMNPNELVARVEARGGCAAIMRSMTQWHEHPLYQLLKDSPVLSVLKMPTNVDCATCTTPSPFIASKDDPALPLKGLKVLDLTRVLAGPVCTNLLAGLGAQVIHVSDSTLEGLPFVDLVTGVGKRSCHLNLKSAKGKGKLLELIREANVFVQAYRPGSLAALGLDHVTLHTLNPSLTYVNISAYNLPFCTQPPVKPNPYHNRRGFDSLVQMETGIAHEGGDGARPVPLPCQALDHATGWLATIGVVHALAKGGGCLVETSLARTSVWLDTMGRKEGSEIVGEERMWREELLNDLEGNIGIMEDVVVRGERGDVLTRVRMPLYLEGYGHAFSTDGSALLGPPEKLGMDKPAWA
ncbi:CoA-transferase family III domain-containing protein [Chytriomyces sp. MP71]|nr:CoA-transferase family III domain-containing protein [Chytriomyces sp. MP71]